MHRRIPVRGVRKELLHMFWAVLDSVDCYGAGKIRVIQDGQIDLGLFTKSAETDHAEDYTHHLLQSDLVIAAVGYIDKLFTSGVGLCMP